MQNAPLRFAAKRRAGIVPPMPDSPPPTPPTLAILGGTGLGEALGVEEGEAVHPDTPFGKPSSPITRASWNGRELFLLQRHGQGHTLNPSTVPYRANLFALKQLGVTHLLASGATGSLREEIHPGELVLVDQFIDRTRHRPSTFYENAAVHVEFSEPTCPVMRRWLLAAASRLDEDIRIHDGGTYVCMEGPSFSTRAESLLHRQMGGDLIGMTALPEARLAREAEIAYALIAMPTDYDAWRPREGDDGGGEPQALLEEIIGNLQRATSANLALMREAIRDVSLLEAQPSPAHDALRLAIWSDKSRIDPAEVKRLAPLWGRYLDKR